MCLPVRRGELLCVWCLGKVLGLARIPLSTLIAVARSLGFDHPHFRLRTFFVFTFKIIMHRK